MSKNLFAIETLSSTEEFYSLESEWNALVENDRAAHVYQNHEWQCTWWKIYGSENRLHILLVRRAENGELLAIFPTYYGKTMVEHLSVSTYSFIGTENYACDYSAPITSSVLSQNERKMIYHQVLEEYQDAPLLQFHNLRQDSDFYAHLEPLPNALSSSPYSAWSTQIDLASPQAIPNRKTHKKAFKRLQKAGEHTIEHFTEAEDILRHLDDFFDQHIKRWKPILGTTQFENEKERELFTEFVTVLAPKKQILFSTVHLEGKLIAAHLGYRFRKRMYWYKPTYDPDYRKLSVGILLLGEVYKHVAEQGATIFDFTIGDESYKQLYSEIQTPMHTIRIPQRWWLHSYFTAVNALQRIKRSLRE